MATKKLKQGALEILLPGICHQFVSNKFMKILKKKRETKAYITHVARVLFVLDRAALDTCEITGSDAPRLGQNEDGLPRRGLTCRKVLQS